MCAHALCMRLCATYQLWQYLWCVMKCWFWLGVAVENCVTEEMKGELVGPLSVSPGTFQGTWAWSAPALPFWELWWRKFPELLLSQLLPFQWFETMKDLVVSSSSSLPFGCGRKIQSEKERLLSCLFAHGFPLERAWGISGTVLGGVLVLSLGSRLAHENAAGKQTWHVGCFQVSHISALKGWRCFT